MSLAFTIIYSVIIGLALAILIDAVASWWYSR